MNAGPGSGAAGPDAGSTPIPHEEAAMDEPQPATGADGADAAVAGDVADPTDGDMALYDLRVVVDRIEGRSVCSMQVGDSFEVTESSRLRIPGAFCLYALQAVLPLLPAKQRPLPAHDWLERDAYVACPDPDERLIMRIERGPLRSMNSDDLT